MKTRTQNLESCNTKIQKSRAKNHHHSPYNTLPAKKTHEMVNGPLSTNWSSHIYRLSTRPPPPLRKHQNYLTSQVPWTNVVAPKAPVTPARPDSPCPWKVLSNAESNVQCQLPSEPIRDFTCDIYCGVEGEMKVEMERWEDEVWGYGCRGMKEA